jgi:DNA-binding MarR family transcriptional regulator
LDAADDPLFVQRGSVVIVYLYLCKRLDFVEFRRIVNRRIAGTLQMKPGTIGLAMKDLMSHGYIERGPHVMDASTYRLVYSRRSDIAPKRQHE